LTNEPDQKEAVVWAAAIAHVIGHAPHAANYVLKAVEDQILERQWQAEILPITATALLQQKSSFRVID
jgi:hypothetical protein